MDHFILNNGIEIPKLVLGSFNIKNRETMQDMINSAISCGITAFDTSPSYGSEGILGEALQAVSVNRQDVFLSDKIDGIQMATSNGDIERFVDVSLEKLKTDYIDLLLVHWPFEQYLTKTWQSMVRLRDIGKVRSIGLCNIDKNKYIQLKEITDIAIPNVIQIELSPLRTAERDVNFFKDQGICVEAYSPLCRMIPAIRENVVLQEIANKYHRTLSQIILRWHLERQVIPVFTSTKEQRIRENADILHFSLNPDDISIINELDENFKLYPESFGCPGY